MRRLRSLTLLLALALAGCGGSGATHTTNSAGTESSQSFVAQANAICERADRKARALTRGSKLEPQSVGPAAALLKEAAEELERLQPPAASVAGFHRFLELARAEIEIASELAKAVARHDLVEEQSLSAKLSGNASNEAARRIGLTVCAKEIE